jgi:RHH-type transcriptional regulator, proline utilization regulon repressor / proline dehydrogenase / delta 1-pyrroline-5-carboxylate dehydrogenase
MQEVGFMSQNVNSGLGSQNLEKRVVEIGRELFAAARDEKASFFDKNFWSGKMMDWALKDPAFKIELFRFVDVLPSLKTSEQISEHIRMYLVRDDLKMSPLVKSALGFAAGGGLFSKLAAGTVKSNVEAMAKNFILGENADKALPALKKLWEGGLSFTVDILGESVVSEEEAELYYNRYLELIEKLPGNMERWKDQPVLENTPFGKTPRTNVSVKCSSLYSRLDPMHFRDSVEGIKTRLRKLLRVAVAKNVFVYLDMEQNDLREILLTVAEELWNEKEFKAYPHFGIVIQAYLENAIFDLERLKLVSEQRGTPFAVRLVKGAYWDYENIMSSQRAWKSPVYLRKVETDANYEKCSAFLIDAYPLLIPAFASHNIRSLAFALAMAEEKKVPPSAIEIQMLFGMAEPFKKALYSKGLRIREYTPVGEMLPGMAYLVRRLLENTSNDGFLKAKFVDDKSTEILLQKPVTPAEPATLKGSTMAEPIVDFNRREVRETFKKTLDELRAVGAKDVRPIVANTNLDTHTPVNIFNPSLSTEVVTKLHQLKPSSLEAIHTVLDQGEKEWKKWPFEKRAEVLDKIAEKLRDNRVRLSCIMTLEVGKNFKESDADLCEAVDFCTYYAAEYRKLMQGKEVESALGEKNTYLYKSRGRALVIAPWNFPLAILCGMVVAPLVCGSTVILKPAEQSSRIAEEFYKLMLEAGVPANVIAFVPGRGEEVGSALVRDPRIHIINFTGSKAVGMDIMKAAQEYPGKNHVKKVLAEMGGKNALIIDDDADLDEAVAHSLRSAFGYQGQKCSALSRLIVVGDAYDTFKARFIEAVKGLRMGPAWEETSDVGPVVDEAAQKRLLDVIQRNKASAVYSGEVPPAIKGNYVPLTIFESTDYKGELGQSEFFGPLVTLFKVKNISEALEIANSTDYALTAGICSRNPESIERIKEELEAGNIYINRPITGAIVNRQPFGGYKFSGVGAKAGGPDYLLQFVEPYCISESLMRRGFSPDVTV